MISAADLAKRFIPFSSLESSTEAFIDYCLPECKPKFNYALIGPGVSQNPKQPVNLREPHGFQVGAVSLPHGKVNPPHMHFTCEVFICFRGDWAFQWGFNPEPSQAPLAEGDIASVPTWVYRGFTNTGVDDGFLFTVLGGDNTGGILWGPATLAAAAAQGVFLTDDYRIIDTQRGDVMPADARPLQPMSAQEIAALRVWPEAEMAQRIARFADVRWSQQGLLDSQLPGCGAQLAALIGLGMAQDRNLQAPISNAHGMSLEWLKIPPGGSVSLHRLAAKQVLLVKAGEVDLTVQTLDGPRSQRLRGAAVDGPAGWDSFSVPPDCWRSLSNAGPTEALLLLMTAGDGRKLIEWDAEVVAAAAAAGWAMDANGYVALKTFVDRAQR